MRYLSNSWIAATAAALAEAEPLAIALTVGYIVTGGPDGDRRYSMIYGPERATCIEGVNEADVSLATDWQTAIAIAQGTSSPQRAFLDGHLRLDGDAIVLIDCQDGIAEFESYLTAVKSATSYT